MAILANDMTPEMLAALARDTQEQSGFHNKKLQELQAKRPLFCAFLSMRLGILFGEDEPTKQKVLLMVAEMSALDDGINFTTQMPEMPELDIAAIRQKIDSVAQSSSTIDLDNLAA